MGQGHSRGDHYKMLRITKARHHSIELPHSDSRL
jgi:hypothetical protein